MWHRSHRHVTAKVRRESLAQENSFLLFYFLVFSVVATTADTVVAAETAASTAQSGLRTANYKQSPSSLHPHNK